MCGICGFVSQEPIGPAEIGRVRAVNAAMVHRGPDGEGEFHDDRVALAMRRLSIIDVEGGWQPIYNEDKSLVLMMNGEIYNYVELREQLQANGHRLATHSDTETIVHLYEEHGADCVQQLRGMFAFALWDKPRRRLVLARDRMGEKPLYLFERPGQLLFASEIRALLRSGLVPFELDPHAADLYFHYQYVPEPFTPVRGVRKLDAAHTLTIDTESWQVEESRYWRMEDAPPIDDDPAERIRAELEAVSEIVIRSDVPVGVALSGGLDSSAVAALAAARYPDAMHAFSVGYPGQVESDERADAKALADHLGMPFHDVELATDDMVRFFHELVWRRDDPIADISGYGYYAVSKLAHEHGVPVMLQGQGGDELFWGYPWVRRSVDETRQKDDWLRRGWRALPHYIEMDRIPGLRPGQLKHWLAHAGGLDRGWHRLQRHRTEPAEQMIFYDLAPDFADARADRANVYGPAMAEPLRESHAADLFAFPRPWPRADLRMTRLICDTYLRENGIAQGDRLGMASSVELRLPLVDHRLIETVIGLRRAETDHGLRPKHRLKAALQGVLPDWVIDRPKRGFTPPTLEWHRRIFAAHGAQLCGGCLEQMGVLTPEACRTLSTGPMPPGAVCPIAFKALVLELWCRRMKDASGAAMANA